MNFSVGAVARSMQTRRPYPSEISKEEWDFVAPHIALVVSGIEPGIRLQVVNILRTSEAACWRGSGRQSSAIPRKYPFFGGVGRRLRSLVFSFIGLSL